MARLRMEGVIADSEIPTPASGTATIFYNSTERIYKVKLDDGSVAPIGSGGGGAVASVNGQTGTVVLTKADIGLSNVDNTSDADKPISSATQLALDAKYDASNPDNFVDAAGAASAAPVQSVAGQTGAVTLSKSDVGLSSVDNTSDADKPVSTATQTALNAKLDLTGGTMTGDINMQTTTGGGFNNSIGILVTQDAGYYQYQFSFAPPANAPVQLCDGPTILGMLMYNMITFNWDYMPMGGSPVTTVIVYGSSPPLGGVGVTLMDLKFPDTYTPTLLRIQYGTPAVTVNKKVTGLADGTDLRDAINRQQLDAAIAGITVPVTSVAGKTGAVTLEAADVSLGNVDNTSDANKPVSTATQLALNDKYDASNPANYVDAAGAASAAPVQSVAGQTGVVTLSKSDVGLNNVDNTADADKPISTATQSALNDKYDASNPANYVDSVGAASAAPVQSVAGKTDVVLLDKADVGLGDVDNTSDLNKPISTATQTALDDLTIYAEDIRLDVDDLTVYAQDIRTDLDLFVAPSGLTRPLSPVVGQIFFDTTLGKPVFYNGSAWVDAAGTVV